MRFFLINPFPLHDSASKTLFWQLSLSFFLSFFVASVWTRASRGWPVIRSSKMTRRASPRGHVTGRPCSCTTHHTQLRNIGASLCSYPTHKWRTEFYRFSPPLLRSILKYTHFLSPFPLLAFYCRQHHFKPLTRITFFKQNSFAKSLRNGIC